MYLHKPCALNRSLLVFELLATSVHNIGDKMIKYHAPFALVLRTWLCGMTTNTTGITILTTTHLWESMNS